MEQQCQDWRPRDRSQVEQGVGTVWWRAQVYFHIAFLCPQLWGHKSFPWQLVQFPGSFSWCLVAPGNHQISWDHYVQCSHAFCLGTETAKGVLRVTTACWLNWVRWGWSPGWIFNFPGCYRQRELRIWPIISIVKNMSSAWLGFHSVKNNVSTSKYWSQFSKSK